MLLFLTIMPMLTSNVVRTLAWIAILGREGVVNNALLGLGLDLNADPVHVQRGRV